METAQRRAIQTPSIVPGFAEGGFIDTVKRAVGFKVDSPELKAYKLKSEQERQAAKTAPQPAPQAQPQAQPAATQTQPQPAQPLKIDYQGPAPLGRQSVIDGRMKKENEFAGGGPIVGPGGPKADKVPIMASNEEFMIKAASAKIIGKRVLNALNSIADLPKNLGKPKAVPVGHYAAGGEIEEDPKRIPQVSIQSTDPMGMQTGGTEMVNASRTRSTVDALADLGKTIVSAPGYGMSPIARRPAAPTPYPEGVVAPASANPSQPLPVSPAGAGRGFVNPPTVTPQRDMSFITPAAAPQGAAATLASTPRVTDQAGLDAIQGRQDAGDRAYAAKQTYNAQVAEAKGINADGQRLVLQQLAMSPNGTPGKANAMKMLAQQADNAVTTRGQDLNTQTTQRGQDITAKTTERGQDVNAADNTARNGISRDRLTMDASSVALDNQAKSAMLKATQALAAARTPEEKVAAEDNLRALQGKYEKAAPAEQYGYAPGGQEPDPATGQMVTKPGVIFNKSTGQTVAPQAAAKPATNFVVGKVYVDGKGNKAKWDGKQFVPA